MDTTPLKPGMRLGVGCSGGADSVALLRALGEQAGELGLVLHVAHLHHGLRGAEADDDLEFVRVLAVHLNLPFHEARVDVAKEAAKAGECIEATARRLRYGWFGRLAAETALDAIATAHTLDDQAETVCAKFLRGAWTEGLSGIHPMAELHGARVVRPLLGTTRVEVELYLKQLGQNWRKDSSNQEAAFARNRIRHELLPQLESWNPRLKEHLAQMAALARDEESWWRAELGRLAPQLILAGKPVRGGGRASSGGLALDAVRVAALPVSLQRRLLRHAAGQLGASLDFPATETLRRLILDGRAGQKLEIANGLRAERTPRELRLDIQAVSAGQNIVPEYSVTIPGEILAPAFGVKLQIRPKDSPVAGDGHSGTASVATLRNWKPGDRVRLRYSGRERKVKEVLERLRITGSSRALWPVLEVGDRIAWMKGVEVEPESELVVTATDLAEGRQLLASKASGDDTFE